MPRFLAAYVTWLAVLSCLASATTFQYNVASDVVICDLEDDRIRGASNRATKDIILGGLFPVHTDSDDGASCGDFRLERGLERMEAMLYALDLINSNDSLLPNITLGYDIRDTCNSENIGLDESLELVIVSDEDSNACSGNVGSGNAGPAIPTTAVVGAAASAVSVPVATLLRLFTIPQVSYASSSARLNNRDRYGYFFRTVPADDHQARAMFDLCLRFGWTYVAIVYVNNFYGEPGTDEFRQLAVSSGKICISVDKGIDEDTNYADVANQLIDAPPALKVVVLFADHVVAQNLFQELQVINSARHERRQFVWIASDAWAESDEVVDSFSEDLVGVFGFSPLTNFNPGFNDYFSQLTPETNLRNPWFPGFYEAYFGCTIGESCSQSLPPITSDPDYEQGSFIPLVIDSVYAVAHVLHNFLQENCDIPIVWDRATQSCKGQRFIFTGENLLDFFYNVTFISPTNDTISFDSEGNVQGRYEITNYQKTGNPSDPFRFVTVGRWIGSATGNELQFDDVPLQFGLTVDGQILQEVDSQCQECPMGQVIRMVQSSCCGVCDPCVGQNYSNTTTDSECQVCPENYWGNNPLVASNSCVALTESYSSYGEPWGIAILVVGALGLIAVVIIIVIFAIYWKTPIVKSSGREQMIILLIGITISFLTPIFYTSKPSPAICFFQRFNLWFCFSLILSALLVKLIRIARIFLRRQTSARPRFVEPQYQVMLTLVFVAAQMVLVLISLVVEYPLPTRSNQTNPENSLDFPTLTLSCASSNVVVLVILILYSSCLMLACNVLAFMTIKFPENFNEAKYVSFSTFCLGLIWLAFLLTYYATSYEYRAAVICFSLKLSAFAVLVCMFYPRAIIMVFFPKSNVAGYVTEAKKSTLSNEWTIRDSKRITSRFVTPRTPMNTLNLEPMELSKGTPVQTSCVKKTNSLELIPNGSKMVSEDDTPPSQDGTPPSQDTRHYSPETDAVSNDQPELESRESSHM